MPKILTSAQRKIIDDFAKEITDCRQQTAKPAKTVINFRTDRADGHERIIWRVPIELLRYRKENGRIASDVLDYENNIGPLDETNSEDQKIIREFLEQKDPEKTGLLRKSILHSGQQEPAIITCDGFLINGNRRKMVLEALLKADPQKEDYAYMKVVILPGRGEPGGPPTLIEIEKLENRYQLQSDGKSEYYGFDRALSIKRKIEMGLPLEEQLRDDPQFAGASEADLKKAVKRYTKNYLKPLECVDRYLRQFNREGQYRTISTGISDKDGRWQAFIDYSETHTRVFSNPKQLLEHGIEEDEIGEIEEAAFDIIRLRNLPDLPKAHVIMRNLGKYCRTKDGKKEIKKIAAEVDPSLPAKECIDSSGNTLPVTAIDAKWSSKFRQPIIHHTKKAANSHETQKDKETPLELLEAAYKKLTHDNMDLAAIAVSDFKQARDLAAKVRAEAADLESQIYHQMKELKALKRKGR